jgi:hypothetical protein
MRRIIRRELVRDWAGRPLSMQSERVTDDGAGALQQTSERTARFCSGCRRPVENLTEFRGVCDWCHTRGCCVHCVSHCQICSRRLCGHCRLGFAGPPSLTVCATCQHRMIGRQVLQDQQVEFEREMARYRMFQQDQALRFNYERTYLMARLQAARMGMNLTMNPERPLRRFLRHLSRIPLIAVKYAYRAVRGNTATRGLSTRRQP